jgi:hypothetical protein
MDPNKIIEEYQPTFKLIEEYAQEFRDGKVDNYHRTDYVMKTLGGIYSNLTLISFKINTELELRDASLFSDKKDEYGDLGMKNVKVSHLKREIKTNLKDFIKAKSVFDSYLEVCDKLIFICQSSLKVYDRERGNQV